MRVTVFACAGLDEKEPIEIEVDERLGEEMQSHQILDAIWVMFHSHNTEFTIADQARGIDRNAMPRSSERARLQGWTELSYQTPDGVLHRIYSKE